MIPSLKEKGAGLAAGRLPVGHYLYKGIWGCAADMGYVFTSSDISLGHKF